MNQDTDFTEDEAFAEAQKIFKGRAMISTDRTRTVEGVSIVYLVGDVGDDTSVTIAGRGFSWRQALANASAPSARRRPASTEKYRGGLDIGQPYAGKAAKP